MMGHRDDASEILLTRTIRERSKNILHAVESGKSKYFKLNRVALSSAADYVIEVIRDNYADLDIPYHSRWRHFEIAGVDLSVEALSGASDSLASQIELAIVSVLLDAGSGSEWRYVRNESDESLQRSEGLAIASLDMFESGAFSSDSDEQCRVDSRGLASLDEKTLAAGFQVTPTNPLIGLASRTRLLNSLGEQIRLQCGKEARLSELFTPLTTPGTEIKAVDILQCVLNATGKIWPASKKIGDVVVADVWQHPHAGGDGVSAGYVPFHKLSQWLSYSLIEPLQQADIVVTDLDGLTGLPEYRNGGLLLDTGVIEVSNDKSLAQQFTVDNDFVVEWRALTVVLLDELADIIREKLGRSVEQLPLASVLQGGTWSAGRRLAAERRQGLPPVEIASDGTVF